MHVAVLVEEDSGRVCHRAAVRPEQVVDVLADLVLAPPPRDVLDGDDERWLGDDPQLPVSVLGQLLHRPETILRHRLGATALVALADAGVHRVPVLTDRIVEVQTPVPEVQVPDLGELGHLRAVAPHSSGDGLLALALAEPVVAACDLEARGQALDVPLPGPAGGLVEVVAVEHEGAVGGSERAEVREVGVAAELGHHPGARMGGEVGSHDLRRPPEEGEGRDQHAPVADRYQLGNAGLRPLLEQRDRVVAVGGWAPLAELPAGDDGTALTTARAALLRGQLGHGLAHRTGILALSRPPRKRAHMLARTGVRLCRACD